MSKALEAMQKALRELERKEIRVGFFETAHYPNGTPVAYVAAIQEFGYGPIPPRPFMRPAQAQNQQKWLAALASGAKLAFVGKIEVSALMDQVGKVAAGDVRKAIKAVTTPALQESTVNARLSRLSARSRKKANPTTIRKPLVDTGDMLAAVTSAVVER